MSRIYLNVLPVFALAAISYGQLSSSAYRELGQADLRQNGINMVQGVEMYNPSSIALDQRDGALHLYVSDTRNHRVLAWQDVHSYQIGDPPALILGQPGPQYSSVSGIGTKGFNTPLGLAVDPLGRLYVADSGNDRVLRFPSPFANPSRIEPDALYGQSGFDSGKSQSVSRGSLSRPSSVGFDSAGNLWIADTGNHRVLRYSAAILDSPSPEADLVIGQKDYLNGGANRSGTVIGPNGFDNPSALAFDRQNNLYVSDLNNARVLKFAAPVSIDAQAKVVFGQADFSAKAIPEQVTASVLTAPGGLSIDGNGDLYVTSPKDNRMLVFSSATSSGGQAKAVLGQADFSSTQANPFAFPLASASTLSGASDVKIDPDGNLYVADAGNNRVLCFQRNSKTASVIWGQVDFSSNGANRIKPGSINGAFKAAIDYSQSPFALYISDTGNHRVLGWRDVTGFRNGDPADIIIGQPDFSTGIANVDTGRAAEPSSASLSSPKGLVVDANGNLYVADSGNNRVLRFPRPVSQSGRITPDQVIGQGDFNSVTSAVVNASSLRSPSGLAIGPDGDLFVADMGNNRILEFSPGGRSAIRVYGQTSFTTGTAPVLASAQTLRAAQGVFVDASSTLYVADTGFNRVLIFPNTRDTASTGNAAALVLGQLGFDRTNAGGGSGGLNAPADVTLDSAGNIYISDSGNHRITMFPSLLFLPLSGAQTSGVLGQRDTNSGAANWNARDGLTTPEGLNSPSGILMDRRDTLYVADAGNNRILHFLKPASAIHAASLQAGSPLGRGGLATVIGSGFSDQDENAVGSSLPAFLANREVVINDDLKAPLFSVGSAQIGIQVPSNAPLGSVRLAVRTSDTAELIAGSGILVASTSPGLFSTNGDGKGQGKILNQDGSANSSSNPALRGSVIKVFGTGQGPVSPSVPDGQPADSQVLTLAVPTSDGNACLTKQPSVCVAMGTVFGDVQFSGMAPGAVGLWQLNVKIPDNATAGTAIPLRAVINGVPTNIVSVAIK